MLTHGRGVLEIVRYRFIFETIDPLWLESYPGSTWRGAFGHALKDEACVCPGCPCDRCGEIADCPYPAFFDAHSGGTECRPFVLEPQAFSGYFPTGSILGLDLVLLGWANGWLPLICAAMQTVGEHGLGRSRARLGLVDVRQQVDAVGQDWIQIYAPGEPIVASFAPVPLDVPSPPPRARLDIIVPLKLKHAGELVRPDTFGSLDLVVALWRRIAACSGVLDELAPLPSKAEWVTECVGLIAHAELDWRDTFHYSSRQGEVLKLGGLIGHVTLQGPALRRLWPWLWLGQWLHIGSSTTIGLGRYLLRPC